MQTAPIEQDEDVDLQYVPVIRLWILRSLLQCNGAASFIRESRFAEAAVAEFLGFQVAELEDYSPAWATRELQVKLAALEAERPAIPFQPRVATNVRRLAERLALTDVEADILHFVVLQRIQPQLSEALELVGGLVRASLVRLLSVCLGHPEKLVQQALRDDGRLCRSALLCVDDSKRFEFGNKVDLLDGVADALTLEHDDLFELFRSSLVPSRPPELSLADFPHLARDIEVLRPYLEAACRTEGTGVNILIHGEPGTGKTEFSKALAAAVGAKLMTVPTESPSGQPRVGAARFESLRFAQSLLQGSRGHVVLFDEVEDVLHSSQSAGRFVGNSSGTKGWVNQLLETNPVPVIWVTNCLEHIDPAYRRRFDYVLRAEAPPAEVRRQLLDKVLGDMPVSGSWRDAVSSHPAMTAASLTRAVKVASCASDVDLGLNVEAALSRVLAGNLDAMGIAPLKGTGDSSLPEYRLDWVNSDVDLAELAEGLARVRSGRLCLWGPPGTGKSEFGRHVAKLLERPCVVQRASEVLSPYVGVSERNIAQLFERASREQAVLVLDEADSFLRDRKKARQSWEVTHVNEMLTAMERFDGIFIASTNLMDAFDDAALRRFDVCVKLDFLRPQQALELFVATAKALGLHAPPALASNASRLPSLTPGDFSAVLRGARLGRPRDAAELLGRLERVVAAKGARVQGPIGFVQ